MVLSDGPVGVCDQRWDERDPSVALPSPTALAATWDEPLVERLGGLLAARGAPQGRRHPAHPDGQPAPHRSAGAISSVCPRIPSCPGGSVRHTCAGCKPHGVAATAKHYVANDSETNRFTVDVRVDERALHELYLAPFEQLVVEGGAWLVMAAYNSVNGVTMTENPLLRDPLKTDWGSMAWSCPTGGRPAPLNQPPRAGWILLCRGRTAHGAPPWPPRSMMAGSRRRRWTTRYGASCGWQPASAPWKESRPTHRPGPADAGTGCGAAAGRDRGGDGARGPGRWLGGTGRLGAASRYSGHTYNRAAGLQPWSRPGTRRSSSSYRPRTWSRGGVVRCGQGEGGSHPPRSGQENTFS
jgi:Glycosyl hydrolase family 3 N terminal domain